MRLLHTSYERVKTCKIFPWAFGQKNPFPLEIPLIARRLLRIESRVELLELRDTGRPEWGFVIQEATVDGQLDVLSEAFP
jgi:hypothetical protein